MKLVILSFILLSSCAHQSPTNSDPIKFPGLDADIREFAGAAQAYSEKHGTSQEAFRNATRPYAPLDLSSPGKLDPQQFHDLRNFTFGIVSGVYKVNPDIRIKEIFCDNPCWVTRANEMQKNIGAIQELRRQFLNLAGVKVISQWYEGNRFRVNDWFYFDKGIWTPQPAKQSGFIPGGDWLEAKGDDLARAEVMKSDALELAKKMRELKIAAILRGKRDLTVIIFDGFADNSYGLLIMSKANAAHFTPPAEGDWHRVEPGIWMFRKGGREMVQI